MYLSQATTYETVTKSDGAKHVPHEYEVVIVGGGPAGMTAALYSTRLGHKTAEIGRAHV